MVCKSPSKRKGEQSFMEFSQETPRAGVSAQHRHLYKGGHLAPPMIAPQTHELTDWAIGLEQPQGWHAWFGRPARPYEIDLGHHQGVIVGATESGTNASMHRIAYNAASSGWKVFFFDAQGSQEDAIAFYAAMHTAGHQRIHLFPGEAYGGWQGTGHALFHRLLQVPPFGREPYYQHLATTGLASVLLQDGHPVRDLDDLAQQLSGVMKKHPAVRRVPRGQHLPSPFDGVRAADLSGTSLRYYALSSLVGDNLNGSWSYDDTDAAYFSFSAWNRPEEARALARYLLTDLARYLAERTQREPRVLFLIKHPERLFDLEQIAPLFAQMERAQGSLFVSARSTADFGKAAPHVLKNASVVLVHRSQSALPFEPYVAPSRRIFSPLFNGGLQQLADQDCFAIVGGRAYQVCVTPVPLDLAGVIRATQHYVTPPRSARVTHTSEPDTFSEFFLNDEFDENEWMVSLEELIGNGPALGESEATGTASVLQKKTETQSGTQPTSTERRTRGRRTRLKKSGSSLGDLPNNAPTT